MRTCYCKKERSGGHKGFFNDVMVVYLVCTDSTIIDLVLTPVSALWLVTVLAETIGGDSISKAPSFSVVLFNSSLSSIDQA